MNWKGRLSFKQFIPSKWRRFGIKQAKVNHAEPGRNLLLFNSYFEPLLQLLPMSVEVMFEGNGAGGQTPFPSSTSSKAAKLSGSSSSDELSDSGTSS